MGLDDVLRAKGDRFFGILNGLDTDLWDPATDAALAGALLPRESIREGALPVRRSRGGRHGSGRPAARSSAMIGRLDRQKGFDILAAAAPALLKLGFRLIVQGAGSPK